MISIFYMCAHWLMNLKLLISFALVFPGRGEEMEKTGMDKVKYIKAVSCKNVP